MKGYNVNKGFSLIELIVVIAILAVFTIMLAPKLLFYTERSRAEKDNSSMDEVVNAIQLALADQKVYDEVLRFSTADNISCYVDTNSEANYQKVTTKSNPDGIDQYTFTSNARLLDETPYFAAGNMRGVTITFAPNKDSNELTYDLKQGVVNQYVQVSGNQRVGAMPELYNMLRSSVGDTIAGNSQTYRNSEYTIFIRLGTIGGNDESAQDAVSVYGQWSGTNLPQQVSYQLVTDRITGDDGKQIVEIDDSKWNEKNGSKITVNPGDLNGGGSFTPGTETGNKNYYTAEDFSEDEKGVFAYLVDGNTLILRNSPREDVSNVTKDFGKVNGGYFPAWYFDGYRNMIEYVDVETPIMLPVDSRYLFNCLENCVEIKNQKNMCFDQCVVLEGMFRRCFKLTELDSTHWNLRNVNNMADMFSECYALKELDVSKWDVSNVRTMATLFNSCTGLKELDVSKWDTSNVVYMNGMFLNCRNIKTLDLSNWTVDNVQTMAQMFDTCLSLEYVNTSGWDTSNVTNYDRIFLWDSKIKLIEGLEYWIINNEAKNMNRMFEGCSFKKPSWC